MNLLDNLAGPPLTDPATERLTPSGRLRDQPAVATEDATQCVRPSQVGTVRVNNNRPTVVGYEILEELGRGGMGVVYKAWQHSLQRSVALKMVIAGSFAAEDDLTRFRAEAMAVARLHHPHLLSIYEIGESNGLPFYAMEYMEGGSLARRLNGAPIAPRSAAALVRSLAQAIDYAHKNGIVHRDLKPANVLLSDAKAPLENCIAKITDFGIAKHLYQDTSCTRTGDILGTPHYMAPEQAIGQASKVGPAADVYSLGAILYELLTGRTPFHGLDGAAVLVRLTREDPERPSHWVRGLPRDLETICLKCLEKDPAGRYASAAALAEDLARYLQSEPIHARPASLLDRAVKWTRRRPAIATILVMTLAVIGLAFGMMTMMYNQAISNSAKQEELLVDTKVLLTDAYLDRGIHLAERGDIRRGMHWILRSLEVTEDLERRHRKKSDLGHIIRMNLASWGQCVSSRELSLPHTDWVWDAVFTPDQRFVATVSKDKSLQIWNAQTGLPVGPPLAHPHAVWGVAFTPDGKTMFTCCGQYSIFREGDLRAWSADPGRPGHFLPRGEPVKFDHAVTRMIVNPHGNRVCLSNMSGIASIHAFDAAAEGNGIQLVATLPGGHQLAAFSPDGATLATVAGMPTLTPLPPYFLPSGNIYLWDARTGKQLGDPLPHNGLGRALAFSKDGRFLIVGTSTAPTANLSETSFVHVWNLAERKHVAQSMQLSGRIKAATVADNGTLFAVSIFEYTKANDPEARIIVTDGHVQLWQLHEDGKFEKHGVPLRTGHVVWSMEFSPDCRMVLAGCENGHAYLWSVSTGKLLRPSVTHEGNSVKVAFRKDGRMAVTASAGGGVTVSARLWEVPLFGHIGPPLPQPDGVRNVYWSADGVHAFVASNRSVGRWNPHKGELAEPLLKIPASDASWFHRTKHEHRVMVNRGQDESSSRLCELDLKTGAFKELPLTLERARGAHSEYHAESGLILQAWLKPCRFRLVSADGKYEGKLIDEPNYELVARGLSPTADVLAVSMTMFQRDNRVVLYNTKDMSVRHDIPLDHPIQTLCFSPDGKTLALGGKDRQVQRLNVDTGAFVGSPLLHEGTVTYVGFLGNDRMIATSNERGQMLLWDAPTGKRIGPAFEHPGDLIGIAVHPKGTHILTATHGKLAMTWCVPQPMQGSLTHIKLWVETMTGMEMREQDTIVPIPMERWLEKRRDLAEMGGAPPTGR